METERKASKDIMTAEDISRRHLLPIPKEWREYTGWYSRLDRNQRVALGKTGVFPEGTPEIHKVLHRYTTLPERVDMIGGKAPWLSLEEVGRRKEEAEGKQAQR